MPLSVKLRTIEATTFDHSSALSAAMLLRLAAVVIACIAVRVFSLADWSTREADLRNAVNVLATASATLLGFLVSAGALLYAVANTRLVRNLQRTGHFNALLRDLFAAAGAFLIALLIALACLFLPKIWPGRQIEALLIGVEVLVFFNVVSYLLLLPVGWKMWVLLSNLQPEGGSGIE
jgi:hypothetical protein